MNALKNIALFAGLLSLPAVLALAATGLRPAGLEAGPRSTLTCDPRPASPTWAAATARLSTWCSAPGPPRTWRR